MTGNCFYYGAYTPRGYFSLATRQTYSARRNYVIRSYSPSVKRRLFDEIREQLRSKGYEYTDFFADCGSDGIFCREADFRIIDGTYMGIDNADFDEVCLDKDIGAKAQSVIAEREEAVSRAVRFLGACRCINDDMSRLESGNIDLAKINRYSSRLWSQTGGRLRGNVGTEHKRFLTAVTSDGVEMNTAAFDGCDKVTVISDRTGVCARKIIDRVRRYALSAGYDVISCLCPMNVAAGAEHIIIPELKYGIFTSKHYHKADFIGGRKIFASRFITDAAENKNRIDFSFKAYKRLMQEVFSSLEKAEFCDSELDKILVNNDCDTAGDFLQALFRT